MENATCFHYLETSHVSSDAELGWCTSRADRIESLPGAVQHQVFAEEMIIWSSRSPLHCRIYRLTVTVLSPSERKMTIPASYFVLYIFHAL